MANVTKSSIVREVSENTKIPMTVLKAAGNAFIACITQHLAEGDHVNIDGFATFTVVEKAERTGRNPQTGESLIIPAHIEPKCKFGKDVKEAVNGR